MKKVVSRAATEENAQQQPHCPWLLTYVTAPAIDRESQEGGTELRVSDGSKKVVGFGRL